jgi:hypothetical protein
MKLTSAERIGRSQLISGVRWTSSGEAATARPGTATPEGLRRRAEREHRPRILRSHPAAGARNQQFIGKNRQLMSFFGNSAIRGPSPGVRHGQAAEVASLFSEALRAAGIMGVQTARGPLSAGLLSRTLVSRLALPSSRPMATGPSTGPAGQRRERSDEATEQGDEADER